jgi:hypothetical protein
MQSGERYLPSEIKEWSPRRPRSPLLETKVTQRKGGRSDRVGDASELFRHHPQAALQLDIVGLFA